VEEKRGWDERIKRGGGGEGEEGREGGVGGEGGKKVWVE